ncbi:MAG: GntR family transcriptional regulator [Sulfuritalea sp.]|nr:GntR family transcriptional regulator [Sulfuritalea sp.]MDP1981314.1 GntR family transcriptional regulator [Sulfuritalea sp.]
MKTRVNRSSLSEQAVGLLREQIYDHRLAPGQRLDEAVLAEQLGISRTPLREALKVLSAEGLVDLQPHKGCFVSELSLRDLEEIFPIMATLEGRVAREVAAKRTPAQLKTLDALHEKLEKHAAAGDVNRYYETNYVFHNEMQECAGNRWLQIVIGDLRKLLKLSRHHSLRLEGRLASSLAEHRALMQALHRQDADAAEQVMRDHLLAQLVALRKLSMTEEPVHG